MAHRERHPLQLQVYKGDDDALMRNRYYKDYNGYVAYRKAISSANQTSNRLKNNTDKPNKVHSQLPKDNDSNEEDSDNQSFEARSSDEDEEGATNHTNVPSDNKNDHGDDAEFENNLVIQAVGTGHIKLLRALIKCGADVNVSHSHSKFSALCMAVTHRFSKCTRLLIKAGANVNHVSYPKYPILLNVDEEVGVSVLMRACIFDKKGKCIDLLLKSGVDLHYKGHCGESALWFAVLWTNYTAFVKLVKAGIDLNGSLGDLNNSPLIFVSKRLERNPHTMKAVEEKTFYGRCFKRLVEAGADLDKQDRYGCTPLIYVAENGILGGVKVLIDAGANVNVANKDTSSITKI